MAIDGLGFDFDDFDGLDDDGIDGGADPDDYLEEHPIETSIIDQLFLELSQFTTARTNREIMMSDRIDLLVSDRHDMNQALHQWQQYAAYCRSCALSGEHNPHDYDQFCKHAGY